MALNPRVMLLFDFEQGGGGGIKGKDLMANMLAAAILLVAQIWQSREVASLGESLFTMCACFINSLRCVNKE